MQTENDSKRLALVIGNSLYDAFSELKNPKKDAEDVKVKLESLGFAVDNDPNIDHTFREMMQDVLKFTKRIHESVTDIVVYYAGHGCSIQGENFLVPVDGLSPEEPSIAKQTYIGLDWLIGHIAKNRPQDIPIIFIVDCCRTEIANNRSVQGDPIKSTIALSNVCIMYATANGHVAMDGEEGRNGTFTEQLLKYLDADMTIDEISKKITKDLNGKQTHWISSTMDDHYRFRQIPKEQTKSFANADLVRVPFRKNNLFIGRANILEDMEQKLRHNQLTGQCVPLVLSGLGGMGKTQLMLQYHYTHRNEYTDIFWLNAEGTTAAMDMFRMLAETLGIKIDENEEGDRDRMLADRICRRLEAKKDRWLLMLDNVETVSDVSRYIPNMGGDVILTTRDHVDKRWGFVIQVDKMSKGDALLLLVGPEKRYTPSEAAVKIIEELDCMPLAIDIVRAYIDRTGTPLKSYLEMYMKESALLLENRQDSNSDQYKNTIATVWNLSFEKIGDQSKLAEFILGICAIMQPDAIPVSFFENQVAALSLDSSIDDIRKAIGLLVQFSFVQRAIRRDTNSDDNKDDDDGNAGNDIMIIHRLVQAVIRDIRMERNNLWRTYERLIAAFDKEIVSGDCYDPQVQRTYALYLPHIREVVRLVDWQQMSAKSQSLLSKLISRIVWHYIQFGKGYQNLDSLANIGLRISEESNGLEHPDTASSLSNMAELFKNQGKYHEAEPLCQRALAIYEKAFGSDQLETAFYLHNLASLYNNQGKYNSAEPLYQQALAIREKLLGPDHSETADALNNLGLLYHNQGKYDLALPLYQRALAIDEKALGPDRPEMASTLHNLALIYVSQHEYNKAESLFEQSLAIKEKVLGPDHPATATSLIGLGYCYEKEGKNELVEQMYQRALAIFEKTLGPNHPDMATPLNNLAVLYEKKSKYEKAEPLFQQALAIREKALGLDHPETARTLNNLADLRKIQSKQDKIDENVLGPDHPEMQGTPNNLNNIHSTAKVDGALAFSKRLWKKITRTRERF